MTLDPSSPNLYRRAPDVVSRRIRGEHVLVPLRRTSAALDSLYTLNETAGFIWEQAGAGLDRAALARAVCARYEVTEAAAATDVARVIGELLAAGALVPAEGAG